jgi:uncharacterized membrane protein
MNNLLVLLAEVRPLLTVGAVVMLLVLAAMIIDLGSGLYKAKQRGDARKSEALRRTLSKFISYEGGLLIAVMVDLLIGLLHFWQLLGIDMLRAVPVVTILIGIFLLVVEFMSVREKADEKTRHKQAEAARLLTSLLTKEDAAALLHAIINKDKSPDNLE